MLKDCTNRVCGYCGEVVRPLEGQDDPGAECCGEVRSYECGDEGRSCSECTDKAEKEFRRGGGAVSPRQLSDEEWQAFSAEMGRLK